MPKYKFIAKNFKGEEKKGEVEAKDLKELSLSLKKEGYILISVTEVAPKSSLGLSLQIRKKVSLKEKLFFIRNFEVMIASGVSLPNALKILARQTKNRYFKKVLNEILDKILKGESLSATIQNYPKIFPEFFSSLILVGEKTGQLDKILAILGDYLEKTHRLRSKVKGAMMYPVVIIVAMIGIGIVMLVKVVPQLKETFLSLELNLPKSTMFILNLGETLSNNIILVVGIPIIFIIFLIFTLKNKQFKRMLGKFFLKIPFISSLVKKTNTAYCARTLSSLIEGGVPIVEALKITSKVVTNAQFRESLKSASEQIKKGKKLSEIFREYENLYPPIFYEMLEVGEKTGKTSQILLKLAEFFEDEVFNITQNLSSIIEPVLLLLIGIVVGFFAISVIRPIYSMLGSFQ